MLDRKLCLVALASLAGTIACSDHPSSTTGPRPPRAAVSPPSPPPPPAAAAHAEALARRLAHTLRSPAFRAYVKAQLDGSPFREHKLHFQRFLAGHGGRALRELARQSGASVGEVEREAAAAIPLGGRPGPARRHRDRRPRRARGLRLERQPHAPEPGSPPAHAGARPGAGGDGLHGVAQAALVPRRVHIGVRRRRRRRRLGRERRPTSRPTRAVHDPIPFRANV